LQILPIFVAKRELASRSSGVTIKPIAGKNQSFNTVIDERDCTHEELYQSYHCL